MATPKLPCQLMDPELWWPVGNSGPAQIQTNQAKAYCEACPIKKACGDQALQDRVEDGVWGGLSPDDRRAIWRRGDVMQRATNEPGPLVRALETTA